MFNAKRVNRHWLIYIYVSIISSFVLIITGYFAERNAIDTTKLRMQNTLAFQTATLKTSMEKYAVLSAVIARRPDVILALRSRNPLDILPSSSQLTLDFIGISGANDIWITDKSGNVLRRDQENAEGGNISEESYFKSAIRGSLGRGNIVTDSGQRLYIIASPIFYKDEILGVVVVRLNLEILEQVLVLLPDPIVVTDATARVLLSNIKRWRLGYFDVMPNGFLSENGYSADTQGIIKKNSLEQASNNKEYLLSRFSKKLSGKVRFKEALANKEGREFLQYSQYIALLNWNIHTFVNYDDITSQRNNVILIAFLLLLLALMTLFMWRTHQKRVLKEQRSQQAFSLRLERQVRDRTHELLTSNERLNVEIEERRNAEEHLREAQDELVQAAKLAGIGQMSTALAHEYNQPLTAIRSYADNAAVFIKNDNTTPAIENLQRIKLLVDKMANLTGTLRRFAHKSTHETTFFLVDSVMDELIILLSPQAKKQQVSLQLFAPKEKIQLQGEQGKLLQIITNLVTNAMDAVAHSPEKQVDIEWFIESKNNNAVILVKDTGCSIAQDVKENMFNAFYTTKQTGNGLGLGLFIVSTLVNDFKGTIKLRDNIDDSLYGAVFELCLPI